MPEDVQEILYRSVPGLENVKVVRPAYGVEYDHVDARELGRKLRPVRSVHDFCIDPRPQLRWKPNASRYESAKLCK